VTSWLKARLGRMRVSTVVLIVAFFALFWVYHNFEPRPAAPETPPTAVVPPGFVPDPNYTWVPRTNVRRPKETPTTETTTPTTTSPTETTTTSPTETTSPTSTTESTPTTTVVPGPLGPQTITQTPTLTPTTPPAAGSGPALTTPVPPR
jgi:cytoskeletal protein RodZ